MLLKSRDGIRCDLCGSVHKSDFSYYSCDGVGLKIANKMSSKTSKNINFDMCEICYGKARDKILSHIKDAKIGYVKDDYSDNFYNNGEYMSITLTQVSVEQKKGGVVSQNLDIDIVLAADSLKDLIKTITEVRKKYKEEDEWNST